MTLLKVPGIGSLLKTVGGYLLSLFETNSETSLGQILIAQYTFY